MRNTKIAASTCVFTLIILICYFQNWLIMQNLIFGYVDEFIALIAILYTITSGRIKKDKFNLMSVAIFIILWGLFCNVRFGTQESLIGIIEDVLGNFKFLFIYLGLSDFLERRGLKTYRVLKVILPIIKLYMVIVFIFALLNLVVDINMDAGTRYGIRMYAFAYRTPGHLINQMTYALILLTAEKEYYNQKNILWMLMCGFIMISTMKTRAFLLIIVYIALIYFFKLRKRKRLGLEIAIIAVIVAVAGFSQFENYFGTEGAPRQMFVMGAIKLVKQYFPFGTGFATYGSSAAAEHYSKLYYDLGYSTRWGMTPDNTIYMNDNYLPMIFAEFGLIFAFVFLCLLYKYCRKVLVEPKRSNSIDCRIITYAFIFDILLSSIQSSYLAHYSVVTLTLLFVTFFYPNGKYRNHI